MVLPKLEGRAGVTGTGRYTLLTGVLLVLEVEEETGGGVTIGGAMVLPLSGALRVAVEVDA